MDNSNKVLSDQIQSMDRQSMLNIIYEKIADKTLSFGCITNDGQYIYLCKGDTFPNAVVKLYADNEEDLKFRGPFPQATQNNYSHHYIIGHPISLGRVLSILGKNYKYVTSFQEIIFNTYDKYLEIPRKLLTDSGADAMLDDQSDDTIRAILTLISEK